MGKKWVVCNHKKNWFEVLIKRKWIKNFTKLDRVKY
jgi:hypothetical protein